jgi:hypothetical protein
VALPGDDPAHGDARIEDIIAKHGGYTMAEHATTTKSGERLALVSGLYALFEIGAWAYCSFQQLITTHDSIVGILQGGTIVPSHLTALQLLAFLQSNMDKDNKIAWTVALITQVIYWGAAFPVTPIHNKLLHRIIIGGFFVLEVVTDLWYSIATNTTIGGAFIWIFSFGNGGWLVSLCYIAAMSVGSMFLGIRGFYRLERVLGPVFRSNATA